MKKLKLTPIQIRALEVLRDQGPLITSMAGQEIWPDRKFKNSQGAALAGGGLLGKLRIRGLVEVKYRDRLDNEGSRWPDGWVLTSRGRAALRAAEEAE